MRVTKCTQVYLCPCTRASVRRCVTSVTPHVGVPVPVCARATHVTSHRHGVLHVHTCLLVCKNLPAHARLWQACLSTRVFLRLLLHTRVHTHGLCSALPVLAHTCAQVVTWRTVLHAVRTLSRVQCYMYTEDSLHVRWLHACCMQKTALHAELLHVPCYRRAREALHMCYMENRGVCVALT